VNYEAVLGTSMELTVWSRHAGAPADAAAAALCEIGRLDALLSTYRPDSEITRFGRTLRSAGSVERSSLLDLYDDWRGWTGGAVTSEIGGRLNVDALGKAFIVDGVVAHLRRTIPELDGIVLNIGGDVSVLGRSATVNVIDPRRPAENDNPLARVNITDRAVATSGSYARPRHLIDPRTGGKANGAMAATVIASDCSTANALATALCVLDPQEGLALVERTPGAESLLITSSGTERRSSGFAAYEQARSAPATPVANWPVGYEVRIALTLTGQGSADASGGRGRGRGGRGSYRSPYVAVWADDTRGRPIRTIAVWGQQWRYLGELPDWWAFARNDTALNTTATRATRPAGEYTVVWNGVDDKGAAVPAGSYRINLEVSREHGTYARRAGVIACTSAPATVTLAESGEFAPVTITYGPRPVSS
jgi:FAD:protein FMN transferase